MAVPTRPRLRTQYYLWSEPPDAAGDETLHFASHRRRVTIKGQSFREFERLVVPLLDGRHTIEEIESRVAHVFAPTDLARSLELLAGQGLLDDVGENGDGGGGSTPQDRFFTELGVDASAVAARLAAARVLVLGLGAVGAGVAQALARAGVGALQCIDSAPVGAADVALSALFDGGDVGTPRARAVARALSSATRTRVEVIDALPATDDELAGMVSGTGEGERVDCIVSCLDTGWSWLQYRLNRACLAAGIPWTTGALAGTEIVMGPTVRPHETACWLCYKMRLVACATSPADEFAFERMLDRRKRDDAERHEGLVFGAGLLSNQLGLEVVKLLSGVVAPSALGRIVVTDLLAFTTTRHTVLRKPWCPDCFPAATAGSA